MGDSFTEGVGTTYDSTWIKSLEFHLNQLYGRTFITINAGVSGSDICYEWVLLKEKLMDLVPDLVIFAINTSDINELIVRGGMERFKKDSTVFYKNPPYWENLYAISYIFRHIIHDFLNYNQLLIKESNMIAERLKAVSTINRILSDIKKFADDRGFPLLFVMHPNEIELKNKAYGPQIFPEITKGIENHSLDLLEHYLKNNIINEQNSSEYYWQIDLHHKTKGYWVMGKAIAEKADKDGLLSR